MVKIDNQFWILMGISMLVVAALTFKKVEVKPSIGSCYIAFKTKAGNSILKVLEKKGDKFLVRIQEASSDKTIKGLFSRQEILELESTSCP